jgi:hypothetical protein
LSDSCSNSDDATNVGGDDGGHDDGGGCSNGYNNEDNNNEDNSNEDWALWAENNHEFCIISFHTSSGYKPPQNRQMPISTHEFYMLFFSATFLKK